MHSEKRRDRKGACAHMPGGGPSPGGRACFNPVEFCTKKPSLNISSNNKNCISDDIESTHAHVYVREHDLIPYYM